MTAETPESLALLVGARLNELHLMLATAESCTGGWVSMAITTVAGSSDWFDRGFVTYSNRSKEELLGVSAATLNAHGAVSEAVAVEMVRGAIEASRAQVAVSVTGIAGPGGGSEDKPVGTVCFAWAAPPGMIVSRTRRFSGDRAEVRRQSVIEALQGLLAVLDHD